MKNSKRSQANELKQPHRERDRARLRNPEGRRPAGGFLKVKPPTVPSRRSSAVMGNQEKASTTWVGRVESGGPASSGKEGLAGGRRLEAPSGRRRILDRACKGKGQSKKHLGGKSGGREWLDRQKRQCARSILSSQA